MLKYDDTQGLHATTTLQALVNLKRPTLLLQQLEEPSRSSIDEITPGNPRPSSLAGANPPRHVLKFNYDATTPHVTITLSVYPTPEPSAADGKISVDLSPEIVYRGTHPGGFNQQFSLPSDYALDLASAVAPLPTTVGESAITLDQVNDKNMSMNAVNTLPRTSIQSEDTNRSSMEGQMGNLQINESTQPELETVPEGRSVEGERQSGRTGRLAGLFRRGQREPDVEEAMEMTQQREREAAAAEEEKKEEEKEKEPEKGMRVLIRIEALGPEGQSIRWITKHQQLINNLGQALTRRNAQLTHILITGTWSTETSATNPGQTQAKRVWIVKVVRREAVIGTHTFLLKEIYGLSSTQNNTSSTYPPNADGQEADPYASTPNECIVCLTSPRDVVLLPCRHLVVCRDCAVGMIEFGAGGKVARREDNPTEGTDGAAGAGASAAGGGAAAAGAAAPPVSGGTTATARERRKKKPKGWYCPVCRQRSFCFPRCFPRY